MFVKIIWRTIKRDSRRRVERVRFWEGWFILGIIPGLIINTETKYHDYEN